jgi:DNA-binding SARP family transcriptional activator
VDNSLDALQQPAYTNDRGTARPAMMPAVAILASPESRAHAFRRRGCKLHGGAVADISTVPQLPDPRVLVCLLGSFRVLKLGLPISLRRGGKVEQLMGTLALRSPRGVPREDIIGLIWPDSDHPLAHQSLSTLIYSLHRLLGDALAGKSPILLREGQYHLNVEEGVAVDVMAFDAAAATGDRLDNAGDRRGAIESYRGALELYAGDLAFGSDIQHLVERERLRSRLLSVLARLADHHFADNDYDRALDSALDLLTRDPCREDAHRMAMRCYVRLGARAQALRQYRVCREALAVEFEAVPERSTELLYELVRLEPARV